MTDGVEPGCDGSNRLRNVRLLVAYDGTDFRGFAESDGVRTVEGELRGAIERVVRRPVELVLGGRTDAGVHGWGQVVNGRLPVETDLYRLMRASISCSGLRSRCVIRRGSMMRSARVSLQHRAHIGTTSGTTGHQTRSSPVTAWHIGPSRRHRADEHCGGLLAWEP